MKDEQSKVIKEEKQFFLMILLALDLILGFIGGAGWLATKLSEPKPDVQNANFKR